MMMLHMGIQNSHEDSSNPMMTLKSTFIFPPFAQLSKPDSKPSPDSTGTQTWPLRATLVHGRVQTEHNLSWGDITGTFLA